MITFSNLGNHGHLGNQMFQYASTIGIARNNGLHFGFARPDEFGSSYTVRSSVYDCFELPKEFIKHHANCPVYNETGMAFDEHLYNNCPDGVDLMGYFQSHKYFDEVEQEIRKRFTFKQSVIDRALIPDESYTTLHVRRTDYIGLESHLSNLSVRYYNKALRICPPDDIIVVVSDDVPWCRKTFEGLDFMFAHQDAYADLYTMTQANCNIISNSSFSWWGAWLNTKSTMTIAPKNWFGPALSHYSTKDLIPNTWKVI